MTVLGDLSGMYDPAQRRLVVETDQLGAPGVSLARSTGATRLVFEGVEAAPAGNDIVMFTGRSLHIDGAAPALIFPVEQTVAATCTVYSANEAPVFAIAVDLTPDWTFAHSFPLLAGLWPGDLALALPSAAGGPKPRLIISTAEFDDPSGVHLTEGIGFEGALSEAAGVMRWVEAPLGGQVSAQGTIRPFRDAAPAISLALTPTRGDAGLAGLFAELGSVPVEARLEYSPAPVDVSPGLHLAATLPWSGRQVRFETVIPGAGHGVIVLAAAGPLPLPSTEDVARYLGGASVVELLPHQLSDALSSVKVDSAWVGIGAFTRRLEFAGVKLGLAEGEMLVLVPGLVEFGDLHFSMTAYFPAKAPMAASYLMQATLKIGDLDLAASATLARGRPLLVTVQFAEEDDVLDLSAVAEKFGLPPGAPAMIVSDFQMWASNDGNFGITAILAEHPVGPGDAFVLTELDLVIQRIAGATDVLIDGLTTIAGIELMFTIAHLDGGWQLSAGMADEQEEIDFGEFIVRLFASFGLAVPAQLPSFKFKNLAVQYDFDTKGWAFSGDSVVAIKLGTIDHEIDTRIDLTVTTDPDSGAHSYAGYLRGTLTLGTAVFQTEYDIGEATTLKGSWDGGGGALGFTDLAASYGNGHDLQPPAGVSLALTRAAFELDTTKGRFLLSAASERGEAFFVASNANQQWNFAFGILARLVDVLPHWGSIGIEDAIVVLSTVSDENFVVPSLPAPPPAAGQPAATARHAFPTLGRLKMKLVPGVSVAALLELGGGGDPLLKTLSGVVGRNELLIQATLDESTDQVSLLSYLDGSLTLAGSGDEKLVLSNVYVQLNANPFAVLIAGSVLIPFNHMTLEASGALALSDNEMEALFRVKAEADGKPASLPMPFGLLGVTLDELDIEVGSVIEPPSVDLGIEGKFNIVGQQVGANSFTIVLALEGEVPDPIYLATHIQSLTVADAITAATGEVVSDLPDLITSIKAEDVSMYWSQSSGTILPDGTVASEGFGFNGIVEIGSFAAHAGLSVGAATGVVGDAEMSPIDWSVMTLTGNGKGVTVKQARINGEWQVVTTPPTDDKAKAPVETRDFQVIAPGGAAVSISSRSSPFIDVSAKVTLFDLISSDVEIEVRNDGFTYMQRENVGAVFHSEFDCTIDKSGFAAKSEFDIEIKGEVGPIKVLGIDMGTLSIDVGFHTKLHIAVDDAGFTLGVAGSFEFEGLSLTMPDLTIHESFKSFEELPGKILQQIKDNADKIFAELFDEAKRLLDAAAKEVEAIASAVADEAKAIASDVEGAARQVGAAAEATVAAIGHGVEEAAAAAAQIGAQTEQALADTAAEVAGLANEAAAEVAKLADEAAAVATAAAQEVEQIANAVADEAKQIAAAAEQVWNGAVAEAEAIGQAAEQAAAAALAAAEQVGEAVLDEARQVAGAMEHEAEEIGNAIEEKAKEIADKAKDAGESAWHAITSIF